MNPLRRLVESEIAGHPGLPAYEYADRLGQSRRRIAGVIGNLHREGELVTERRVDVPDSQGKFLWFGVQVYFIAPGPTS